MSWNPSYAKKTLEKIAKEIDVQILSVEDGKFVTRKGSVVSPVPLAVDPIILQMWSIWDQDPRYTGDVERIRAHGAKYARMDYVCDDQQNLAHFLITLYK